MNSQFTLKINYVDIFNKDIFPARITVENGIIKEVSRIDENCNNYILPAFIDSHIHIESSMLTPIEFAKAASIFGTAAVVADPHEIANVLGKKGVEFMINNASNVPFKFYFGAPSCVPATTFETSGSTISINDIQELFEKYNLKYLSEMMNVPGVIFENPEVIAKIELARKLNKKIDGHAPLLSNKELEKYINSGITTDHECTSFAEAEEKIHKGMKIQIRCGSAANNFEELWKLIDMYPDKIMFASDDLHPDDLIKGHINLIVKKAIKKGANIFNILNAAIKNPVEHYNLDLGLLRKGDDADFIIIDNLNENFKVLQTYCKGKLIADNGQTLIQDKETEVINNFIAEKIIPDDIKVKANNHNKIKVIVAKNNELLTGLEVCNATINNGFIETNIENDILKIVNLNRYATNAVPAVAFIKGIGIKKGAIASSVAHDSHNIIAVGTNDEDIANAINLIIENKGGLAIASKNESYILELPIAGLISNKDAKYAAEKYTILTNKAKELGTNLSAPFMTLSFLALLVIPELKLSDKGLFDGKKFEFTEIYA